jgi:hypothetical protein
MIAWILYARMFLPKKAWSSERRAELTGRKKWTFISGWTNHGIGPVSVWRLQRSVEPSVNA